MTMETTTIAPTAIADARVAGLDRNSLTMIAIAAMHSTIAIARTEACFVDRAALSGRGVRPLGPSGVVLE